MDEPAVARLLRTAEVWVLPPGGTEPELFSGWEDGAPFCMAVCTTDVGLAFCGRCPTGTAARAIHDGRAATGRCPAGVRLLAFPAPRGARDRAVVLRVGRPTPRQADAVAEQVRVLPLALRRAARRVEHLDGHVVLAAAHLLRDPVTLHRWQVRQRNRSANRRRIATAALAQMIATSEEFHELYRASQRQRTELERQRRLLDRLARASLRSQDDERARIAHQIHDTAAQSMVSAYRFLDAARSSSAAGRADVVDAHLTSADGMLQAAIGEVRAVLASLLPPGLEELGVGHAVSSWLSRLTGGTEVGSEVVGSLPRLEGWVEQALYAMAVEAASNAFRHAHPTMISVELGEKRGRAVIVVRDDGRGFDPGAAVERRGGKGLGLLGMRRQASWLRGQATIRSSPGGGTVVRISVPLERHRAAGAAESGRSPGAAHSSRPDGRPARRRAIEHADGEG
jgi:signal transduction histidine kinase